MQDLSKIKSQEGWQNLGELLSLLSADSLKFVPRIGFEEWGPENMRDPKGKQFKWRPYQVAPARDMFSPLIPWMAAEMYSGAGKTHMFNSGFVYGIHQRKLACGIMYPNETTTKQKIADKLMPFFDMAKCALELAIKKDVNLKLLKEFISGGKIEGVGANSATAIRTLEIDLGYADEVDSITEETTDEGDKVDQFFKRMRDRKTQIKWLSSFPSVDGLSLIHSWMEDSDFCRWWMECPRCTKFAVLHTRDIDWAPGKTEDAVVKCPLCGNTYSDQERRESSMESGHWRNKEGTRVNGGEALEVGNGRGYHLGCMAHVGDHAVQRSSYLHEIAAELEAIDKATDRKEKKRRVFVNTMDAEPYKAPGESTADPNDLYERREDYTPEVMLPEEVLFLTGGGDVQKDRVEIEIVGHGANGETWGIDYVKVHGRSTLPSTWADVDKVLLREYKHPLVDKLRIAAVCIDSRYQSSRVRRFAAQRSKRKVFAIVGSSELGRPLIQKDKPKEVKAGGKVCKIYEIGTHEGKEDIYNSLDLVPEEGRFPPNYSHFPKIACYDSDYFKGLTCEKRKMKQARDGQFVPFFVNPPGGRNEPLDMRVYALAAKAILKPNFSKMIAFMESKKAEKSGETTAIPGSNAGKSKKKRRFRSMIH